MKEQLMRLMYENLGKRHDKFSNHFILGGTRISQYRNRLKIVKLKLNRLSRRKKLKMVKKKKMLNSVRNSNNLYKYLKALKKVRHSKLLFRKKK